MARDGTSCNFNQRGSSTPFTEHGLCRQTESHNGGTIAPQRSTERAAILSTTNGTTRGECFQPPRQTTWSWQAKQADIGGLWKELKEEWRTELEKEKRKHELELKQLKEKILEKSRLFEELQGERRKVERSIYKLKKERSELKREVEKGNRERESLEQEIERGKERQEELD